MYKLIEGKQDTWELGPLTARREKMLAELDLVKDNFNPDDPNNLDQRLIDLTEKLDEDTITLCSLLFDGREILEEELMDLNKFEVRRAGYRFFFRGAELYSELMELLKNLPSQTQPTNTHD